MPTRGNIDRHTHRAAMTVTVKLDPLLEQSLRRRSAALGRPASELIREALRNYLEATPEPQPSAYELGEDLFGRHRGPANLAGTRKAAAARIWADKHRAKKRSA
jgi:hypothetical protein